MIWTKEKITELKHLVEVEGLSASQIAERFNVSRASICGIAFRNGFKTKFRKLNPSKRKPVKNPRKPKAEPNVTAFNQYQWLQPILKEIETPVSTHVPQSLKSYDNLTDKDCKWQIGDLYCGDRVEGRKSYCQAHCKIMYQPKREVK